MIKTQSLREEIRRMQKISVHSLENVSDEIFDTIVFEIEDSVRNFTGVQYQIFDFLNFKIEGDEIV